MSKAFRIFELIPSDKNTFEIKVEAIESQEYTDIYQAQYALSELYTGEAGKKFVILQVYTK